MPDSFRPRLTLAPGRVNLAGYDSFATHGADGKKAAEDDIRKHARRLSSLGERLWAEAGRNVLLVLQGTDTAGKGGVVEHVVGLLGPASTSLHAFKRPTPEEAAHHFLWRIRRALPPVGKVGVFDRSHYEDVLSPRVHGKISPGQCAERFGEINAFEQQLVDSGTTIIKCFLHISYATQRERLLARLDDPTKHWKFSEGDIDERAYWSDYDAAYSDLLESCNTPAAPWYVIPSGHKWYRNWAVARILLETLEEMDPQYPQTSLDIPRLKERLRPPY